MITENFNIQNIIKFQINASCQNIYPFNRNLEYEYFKYNGALNKLDFVINTQSSTRKHAEAFKASMDDKYDLQVGKYRDGYSYDLKVKGLYNNKTSLDVNISYRGFRKYNGAYYARNLFVRPLISLQLIKKGATLIHGGGVLIDGKSIIIAGRPGVFKTSLIMDAIRDHNATFYGDENIIIQGNRVFPFPINISSFLYKLEHYKDENAESDFEKFKLWSSLFRNRYNGTDIVAEPSKVKILLYLIKGDGFRIKKISVEEIFKHLLYNELEELNLPPTHSLSGIPLINFYDYILEYDNKNPGAFHNFFIKEFQDIITNLSGVVPVYEVLVPQIYSKEILHQILSTV